MERLLSLFYPCPIFYAAGAAGTWFIRWDIIKQRYFCSINGRTAAPCENNGSFRSSGCPIGLSHCSSLRMAVWYSQEHLSTEIPRYPHGCALIQRPWLECKQTGCSHGKQYTESFLPLQHEQHVRRFLRNRLSHSYLQGLSGWCMTDRYTLSLW